MEKAPVGYIVSIVVMLLLGLSVIFSSFIAFTDAEKKKNKDVISNGTIVMTYTDDTNGIAVNNKLSLPDEVGRNLSNVGEYFDFVVLTELDEKHKMEATYEITLIKDTSSTLNDDDVRIYLERKEDGEYVPVIFPTNFNKIDKPSLIGSPLNSMILYSKKVKKDSKEEYRLRMWISDKAVDFTDKNYAVKVNIYGKAK